MRGEFLKYISQNARPKQIYCKIILYSNVRYFLCSHWFQVAVPQGFRDELAPQLELWISEGGTSCFVREEMYHRGFLWAFLTVVSFRMANITACKRLSIEPAPLQAPINSTRYCLTLKLQGAGAIDRRLQK